jgi:cytochrome oxidase Cu insertion factor (SCO1/SenC/PrrC family)
MPRRFLPVLVLLVCAGCGPSAGRTKTEQPSAPELDYPVGAFALTERDGRTVTEKNLAGKVWVASFVFTRCPGPCPAVTAAVARLQADLADVPDARFVTFTVDPKRDNPGELKKYADRYKADPQRWLFLTGTEEEIHALMKNRFKLALGRKEGPDGKPDDDFDHSTRLMVVDRAGVIRATFDGVRNDQRPDADAAFEDGLTRLKDKVRALAAGK